MPRSNTEGVEEAPKDDLPLSERQLRWKQRMAWREWDEGLCLSLSLALLYLN